MRKPKLRTETDEKPKELDPNHKGVIPSSQLKRIQAAQEILEFDFKLAFSKWNIRYWVSKFKESTQRRKIYLILMKLRNGKLDMFYVATNLKHFVYKDGAYVIDQDMIVEDTHSRMATLSYHQDISIPYKDEFDLDELFKVLKDEVNSNVTKALNPYNLNEFLNSDVVSKILKGQELSDELRLIKILLIISLIMTAGSMLMMARAMGWI